MAMRVVTENGQGKIEVRNQNDMCLACTDLVLSAPGCGPLKVAADGKQVMVSGHSLKASADKLTTDSRDRLTLSGHVELWYHAEGRKENGPMHKVSAETAVLDLTDGGLTFHVSTKSAE
jgi:hypothetical protein